MSPWFYYQGCVLHIFIIGAGLLCHPLFEILFSAQRNRARGQTYRPKQKRHLFLWWVFGLKR